MVAGAKNRTGLLALPSLTTGQSKPAIAYVVIFQEYTNEPEPTFPVG
jgi:hypothetical protein